MLLFALTTGPDVCGTWDMTVRGSGAHGDMTATLAGYASGPGGSPLSIFDRHDLEHSRERDRTVLRPGVLNRRRGDELSRIPKGRKRFAERRSVFEFTIDGQERRHPVRGHGEPQAFAFEPDHSAVGDHRQRALIAVRERHLPPVMDDFEGICFELGAQKLPDPGQPARVRPASCPGHPCPRPQAPGRAGERQSLTGQQGKLVAERIVQPPVPAQIDLSGRVLRILR